MTIFLLEKINSYTDREDDFVQCWLLLGLDREFYVPE